MVKKKPVKWPARVSRSQKSVGRALPTISVVCRLNLQGAGIDGFIYGVIFVAGFACWADNS